jgi:ATP-dependent DNA helicase RecG
LKSTLKGTLKGTKKKIIEIMANDSTITIPQIAEQLNLHPRGIAKHIKQLQEQLFIQRIGGDNGGHWEVVDDASEQ